MKIYNKIIKLLFDCNYHDLMRMTLVSHSLSANFSFEILNVPFNKIMQLFMFFVFFLFKYEKLDSLIYNYFGPKWLNQQQQQQQKISI